VTNASPRVRHGNGFCALCPPVVTRWKRHATPTAPARRARRTVRGPESQMGFTDSPAPGARKWRSDQPSAAARAADADPRSESRHRFERLTRPWLRASTWQGSRVRKWSSSSQRRLLHHAIYQAAVLPPKLVIPRGRTPPSNPAAERGVWCAEGWECRETGLRLAAVVCSPSRCFPLLRQKREKSGRAAAVQISSRLTTRSHRSPSTAALRIFVRDW